MFHQGTKHEYLAYSALVVLSYLVYFIYLLLLLRPNYLQVVRNLQLHEITHLEVINI